MFLFETNDKLKNKGFTLIELLVVIAIIGILAGFVLNTSIKGAARARDAKRISELNEIARALKMYYSDHHKFPDNTDNGDVGCWGNWDAGNLVNGPSDPFISPLVKEGYISGVPIEKSDIKDGWGSQCTYRYMRVKNPCCGCSGTYAVLYAACETDKCPVNERPSCCTCWGEGAGSNDPRDITIFLKE